MCWCKSRSLADKMVDTNKLAGDSNRFDVFEIVLSFLAPMSLIGLAVAASGV